MGPALPYIGLAFTAYGAYGMATAPGPPEMPKYTPPTPPPQIADPLSAAVQQARLREKQRLMFLYGRRRMATSGSRGAAPGSLTPTPALTGLGGSGLSAPATL